VTTLGLCSLSPSAERFGFQLQAHHAERFWSTPNLAALVSCKPEFGGAKEGVEAKHGREREAIGSATEVRFRKQKQA